jgi:putative ABC transport system substrate-binding protein
MWRRSSVWKVVAILGVAIAGLQHMVTAAVLAVPATHKKVLVTAIVDHPALNSVRDGIKKVLSDSGYNSPKTLQWEYQSAQANTAIAAQIARKFVGERPDVIVAIATPSAQAVVASTKQVPVVYAAVTDPVAARLVPSLQASHTNVTGVSDALAVDKQISLIRRIVPTAKRVGMIYNPGEDNSIVVVRNMELGLAKAGLSLVKVTAQNTANVGAAARSLIGKVDVIYTSTDNNVISAYESIVQVGNDFGIPLVAADNASVERGAVAALGIDYERMGQQVGRMVLRILKDEKPGDIPSEVVNKVELYVNQGAAKKQNVTFSPAVLKSASRVFY